MLNAAVEAARAAGKALLDATTREIIVDKITRRDVKLAMDREAERIIIGTLQKHFPGHSILSEERGTIGPESEYRWVIDPLDGTFNYFHRIPFWATSIALQHNGEDILGVVFDPLHDELYTAEENKGAFLNGKRLAVSPKSTVHESTIAYGYPAGDDHIDTGMRGFDAITQHAAKIRELGAAALHVAYVAAGRIEGTCEYGLKLWDFAAGNVIVREAGGRIYQSHLEEHSYAHLATNAGIYDEFMELLKWKELERGKDG